MARAASGVAVTCTLLITGHRPPRLGGYSPYVAARVDALATRLVGQIRPDAAILGMAQGWDQACAVGCVTWGVPFTAVLPALDQCGPWPPAAQARYHQLLAQAARVVQCDWPGTGLEYHARDEKMVRMAVEAGDALCLALWSGGRSGTGMTVRMAGEWSIPVWNAWGEWSNG